LPIGGEEGLVSSPAPHRSESPVRLHTPLSELAAANRQRDALYQLSEQLHRATTSRDVYEAALDAIETALGCDRSSVLLLDDAGIMQFVAWRGLSNDYRASVAGHSPWDATSTDQQPIPVPNVASAELPEDLKSVVLNEGIHATAFIPLVSDGVLIGKFMAYFRAPYEFTKDDLAVSLAIARQLAFSIQRQRTDQRLREREAELDAELSATRLLQSLSIDMANEPDIGLMYGKLVDGAQTIMGSDFASMQQYHPDLGKHGELQLLGARGFNPEATRFWTWVRADSKCTCGRALATGKRVLAADVEKADYMAGSADLTTYRNVGIRAVQSTPLFSRRGKLVGMISTHWKDVHELSERDLRFFDILARLAADLIERKTDDDELRRREERARTLTQLLTDVPWQARSDGAFDTLQPAWENFTGQSWDAHAGHGWFEAIHADDRDGARAAWSSACFEARPYEFRARLWHAAGKQYRHCLIKATPIRADDGSVLEWVGACTEVQPGAHI
jgi:PAS domain S-box-containing protein